MDEFPGFRWHTAMAGAPSCPQVAAWRDSDSVCALVDDGRHMGHMVKAGSCWLAYDATRTNESGTGFRLLGSWKEAAAAKFALEEALAPALRTGLWPRFRLQ